MLGHVRNRGKRADGSTRWEARYTDPERGGTTKIARTFATKRAAESWLVEQQASILSGTHVSPRAGERPFAEVVEAWKEAWGSRLSPTTANRYEQILARYLLPEFGRTQVGKITHEVVQRYINRLASRSDLAPGTVRAIYSVLRTSMGRGVRMGLVRVNPCAQIDLPRSPREEMLFLSAPEVALVAEAIDPYYRVLIYSAAFLGLRAGELLALRRGDLDLLRGVVHVRRSLRDVNGHLSVGPTKTYSTRTVSLPRFLRDMLSEHLAAGLPGGTGPDALLFPSRTGLLLRHGLFYRRHFKVAVRKALPPELHGLRFHDLRHTCAALSVAAGAHPKLISARLGHASVAITLDRYSHLFPSIEEALAEQLDAAFRAAPPASNVAALRP